MTKGPTPPAPFKFAPRPLHTGRLLLTPRDATATVASDTLCALLTEQGLLGAPLPGAPEAFQPGDGLHALIGFSGCAVTLPTSGADGAPALHLRLLGPYPAPRLLSGRNSRPPRCPGCGKPRADWRAAITAASDTQPQSLTCLACGAVAPAWNWHWRGQAGCGRLFIACEEVFPGEGQPLPRLLRLLEALGVGPWQHFYVQD